MDQKLKEFFDLNEVIEKETLLKEKQSVLIECGLYNTEKEYSDKGGWGYKHDPETKKYYKVVKVPIEVTDEEYSQVLEIYRKKQNVEIEKEEEKKLEMAHLEPVNPHAERILNFIIKFELIMVIIVSIVLLIVGIYGYFSVSPMLLILGIVLSVSYLVIGLLIWAMQKVIINMSNNLHNISNIIQSRVKK